MKKNHVVVFCLLLVFLATYHQYYKFPYQNLNKEDYPIDNYPIKVLNTRKILETLCDPIPNEEIPTILLEPMEVMEKVNYTDPKSLENFCKPYVYTKIFLKLGSQNANDCDPLATKRGRDCEWYHMCVWPGDEDQFISRRIIGGGIWDESFVRFLINSVKDKERGIVIDAGANIGQFTLTAALLGHQVFSFEPIPQHIEMIKRSLALNGISDRVLLFRNGLSDYFSQTYINLHKDNKGGSTIEKIGSTVDESATDSRFIPGGRIPLHLITIDSVIPYISKYPNYKIHFWKADIEGYESRMLRGSWKFLSTYQPIIIFEVMAGTFSRTKCDIMQLFYGMLDLNFIIERSERGIIKRENVISLVNDIKSTTHSIELILYPQSTSNK